MQRQLGFHPLEYFLKLFDKSVGIDWNTIAVLYSYPFSYSILVSPVQFFLLYRARNVA
jgi:hypothetical protein